MKKFTLLEALEMLINSNQLLNNQYKIIPNKLQTQLIFMKRTGDMLRDNLHEMHIAQLVNGLNIEKFLSNVGIVFKRDTGITWLDNAEQSLGMKILFLIEITKDQSPNIHTIEESNLMLEYARNYYSYSTKIDNVINDFYMAFAIPFAKELLTYIKNN